MVRQKRRLSFQLTGQRKKFEVIRELPKQKPKKKVGRNPIRKKCLCKGFCTTVRADNRVRTYNMEIKSFFFFFKVIALTFLFDVADDKRFLNSDASIPVRLIKHGSNANRKGGECSSFNTRERRKSFASFGAGLSHSPAHIVLVFIKKTKNGTTTGATHLSRRYDHFFVFLPIRKSDQFRDI